MTTDPTPTAPPVIPQGYPLWAVRAASGPGSGDQVGVGLVVGWEPDPDGNSAVLTPVVAEITVPELADITDLGALGYGALPWRAEPSRDPRSGCFERVEVHATREAAVVRAPRLLDEARAGWAGWSAAAPADALSASQAPVPPPGR